MLSTQFPGISDLMFLSNKTENAWKKIKTQVSIVLKSVMSVPRTFGKDAKWRYAISK